MTNNPKIILEAPSKGDIIIFRAFDNEPEPIVKSLQNSANTNWYELTHPVNITIRKQQLPYYLLLREVIEKNIYEVHNVPDYYVLKVPIWTGTSFSTFFYIHDFENRREFLLKIKNKYTGEPLQPKLGYEGNRRGSQISLYPIPGEWKVQSLLEFYKRHGRDSFPFSNLSISLLKKVLEYEKENSRKEQPLERFLKGLGFEYETKSLLRQIGFEIKQELGIRFKNNILVARYWSEMGLAFPIE